MSTWWWGCLAAGMLDRSLGVGRRGWAGGQRVAVIRGFRFPAEIISHCVWLYHRFTLSFREVEEMMLQRGVVVSHETVRQWCGTFGAELRQRAAPPPGPAGRQVARRRGVHHDQRQDPLSVAGGGPARQRARHSGHLPPGHPRPRPGSFASCSRACGTCPGCWSPTFRVGVPCWDGRDHRLEPVDSCSLIGRPAGPVWSGGVPVRELGATRGWTPACGMSGLCRAEPQTGHHRMGGSGYADHFGNRRCLPGRASSIVC
jgi:hypothetical protein